MSLKTYNTESVLNDDGSVSATASDFHITIDAKNPNLQREQRGMSPIEAGLNGVAACELSVMKAQSKASNFNLINAKINITGVRNSIPDDGYYGLEKITMDYYIQSSESSDEITKFVEHCQVRCPLHATIMDNKNIEFKFVIHIVR